MKRVFAMLLLAMLVCSTADAEELRGLVTSGGFPVPGATVTVQQGSMKLTTTTDERGIFRFADVAAGVWKVHTEMLLFTPQDAEGTAAAKPTPVTVEMKMLPAAEMLAKAQAMKPQTVTESAKSASAKADEAKKSSKDDGGPTPPPPSDEAARDGLLVNGSQNNASTSKYSLDRAFGNQRGSRSLYTGGFGLHLSNSALNARPYSLTGLSIAKPSTSQVTMVATLGGPIRIPHLLPRGPNFFLAYQWTRDSTANALSGLMPTLAQRTPGYTVDPVAQALLALYPLPNFTGSSSYNYQRTTVNHDHEDAVQLRLDKSIGSRDSFNGTFASENGRSDSTSIFGFTDSTKTLGLNGKVNWQHRLHRGLYLQTGYRFSRQRTDVVPFFMGRTNIAGNAGMTGNLQDVRNWGPPALTFSSGIYSLGDGQSAFNRFRTEMGTASVEWYRGRHDVEAGGDFRRQSFNYLQQTDPRGTFNFTGLTSSYGSDFDSFLHGVPDSASIAYGNADKYLRQNVWNLYVTDDWRIRPDFSLNIGIRWEYSSPVYELKNRLVNLDVASDFTAATQVLASSPMGTTTGQAYPRSLVRPDRNNVQPRIGFSWRPIPGSSMVVRGGYGIYSDTSVYRGIALNLAQQAPLSHTVSVSNSTACPQTLASGPNGCGSSTSNTFAMAPNFQTGQAQMWQLSVQRDFPFALQITGTYNGIKGLNGVQDFLPNTYAPGGTNPCPSCPVGFMYRSSNGSSTRHAGTVQVRRRLRSGFTASVQYTWAHAIDSDSMLGGQGAQNTVTSSVIMTETIAQNWRDLRAERSRSNFDQRHVWTGTFQYTTGMGLAGGTLMKGWAGRFYKEWTVAGSLGGSTGKPLTPVYYATLEGTGYTGVVRANRTGADVYAAPSGRYLNPNAFAAPSAGQFGNAGRYSITGPGALTFDASLSRTFRLTKRYNLDVRADATNVLNHAALTSYNTIVNTTGVSPTFGVPTGTGSMRSMEMTARLRF